MTQSRNKYIVLGSQLGKLTDDQDFIVNIYARFRKEKNVGWKTESANLFWMYELELANLTLTLTGFKKLSDERELSDRRNNIRGENQYFDQNRANPKGKLLLQLYSACSTFKCTSDVVRVFVGHSFIRKGGVKETV